MVPLINSFHVAMHLLGNRSQMTSKFVKSKHVTHEVQPSVSVTVVITVLCNMESICLR